MEEPTAGVVRPCVRLSALAPGCWAERKGRIGRWRFAEEARFELPGMEEPAARIVRPCVQLTLLTARCTARRRIGGSRTGECGCHACRADDRARSPSNRLCAHRDSFLLALLASRVLCERLTATASSQGVRPSSGVATRYRSGGTRQCVMSRSGQSLTM